MRLRSRLHATCDLWKSRLTSSNRRQSRVEVSVVSLLMARRDIQGWPSGTAMDSEDTLRFSSQSGVRAMIEKFPLEKANEAYARMMSGNAQFRVVLTM
jgi:D-arabinose 1-dehydrogenase-like Zn-dependent alcohol dehydrogenase